MEHITVLPPSRAPKWAAWAPKSHGRGARPVAVAVSEHGNMRQALIEMLSDPEQSLPRRIQQC